MFITPRHSLEVRDWKLSWPQKKEENKAIAYSTNIVLPYLTVLRSEFFHPQGTSQGTSRLPGFRGEAEGAGEVAWGAEAGSEGVEEFTKQNSKVR